MPAWPDRETSVETTALRRRCPTSGAIGPQSQASAFTLFSPIVSPVSRDLRWRKVPDNLNPSARLLDATRNLKATRNQPFAQNYRTSRHAAGCGRRAAARRWPTAHVTEALLQVRPGAPAALDEMLALSFSPMHQSGVGLPALERSVAIAFVETCAEGNYFRRGLEDRAGRFRCAANGVRLAPSPSSQQSLSTKRQTGSIERRCSSSPG
jgi:hypothetical protein